MGSSNIYLLLGENNGKAEGEKTKGSWGKLHMIPNNKGETFTLHDPPSGGSAPSDTKIQSTCLVPVKSMNHSLGRMGSATNMTEIGLANYAPVSLTISPWAAVRMNQIVRNLIGREGESTKKINFKIYLTRSTAERGKQVVHNWLTMSGTNGVIEVLSDPLDADMSLVLSAEIWRWQNFESAGAALRDVFSSSWDPRGEKISKGQLC